MLVKLGVDISRLNRPIRRALTYTENVFAKYDEEAVITSTYEGNHSASSLHYCDDAIDVRNPKYNRAAIKQDLKDTLGKDFDVVSERDHIHVEYDPKG